MCFCNLATSPLQGQPETTPSFLRLLMFTPGFNAFKKHMLDNPGTPAALPHVHAPHFGKFSHLARHTVILMISATSPSGSPVQMSTPSSMAWQFDSWACPPFLLLSFGKAE